MKQFGINLKRIMLSEKKPNLKRSHTILFHLYDIHEIKS